MYTFSILGFFDTPFFIGPLTFGYKPAHSLTNSQLLSSTRSFFPPLPVSLLLTSFGLTSHFTKVWIFTDDLRSNSSLLSACESRKHSLETGSFFSSQWHVSPQHPAVSIWVHRHTSRAEGLLICAIDFLIGSAPRLVNENMLWAGNETWSSRRLHVLKCAGAQERNSSGLLSQRGEVLKRLTTCLSPLFYFVFVD